MFGIHQYVKRNLEAIKKARKGKWKRRDARLILILIGLVKQEVGSQLLILVTGKVGLDDSIPGESKTAQLENASGVSQKFLTSA